MLPEKDLCPARLAACERIALVNPTKFLGNLLLAGGLIQDFQRQCEQQDKSLLVVLDDSFRGLVEGALPASSLMFYPRQQISQCRRLGKLAPYLECLRQLRTWGADIAFNIEEDSVSHRLTQLSGARYKLGCSPQRHDWGYDRVIPIDFTNRPVGRRHRWYSFYEMFAALGLPENPPGYMRLRPRSLIHAGLRGKLEALGVDFSRPLVALHAGGSKRYKRWPLENFTALSLQLIGQGFQPLFIGAGSSDKQACLSVLQQLREQAGGSQGANTGSQWAVDLCDLLSLTELASLLPHVSAMVGNDSGPFHLASALGVPGLVLFGPTDVDIWRPLGTRSEVVRGLESCAADCSRRSCRFDYRCLSSITPNMLYEKIARIINI